MRKLELSKFIGLAIKIHGRKYDYSKSTYINSQTKTEIICPSHGSFFQIPNNHIIHKQGCPRCATETKASNQRKSLSDFIHESILVHNNFYKYSKSIYKKYHTKIEIICPVHGSFWQEPSSHLLGCGCPQCKKQKIRDKNRKSLNQFVKDANLIHHNKYDYSKFQYSNSHKEGEIICHKHGIFRQTPTNHLSGKGCPKCGYNISDPEVKFIDYINLPEKHRHQYINPYKVDGYDPKINTIYEFLGDYWHGNPELYNTDTIHPRTKITFGEMYGKTMLRLNKLKSLGYEVKYIWESDWNKFKRGEHSSPKILSV